MRTKSRSGRPNKSSVNDLYDQTQRFLRNPVIGVEADPTQSRGNAYGCPGAK